MAEIPGYVLAFSYWAAAMTLLMITKEKKNTLKVAGISALVLAGVILFTFFMRNLPGLFFLPNLFGNFLLFSLLFRLLSPMRWLRVLYLDIVVFTMGEFASSAVGLFYRTVVVPGKGFSFSFGLELFFLLGYLLFYGIAYLILSHYEALSTPAISEYTELLPPLLIALLTFWLSNFSYIPGSERDTFASEKAFLLMKLLFEAMANLLLISYQLQLNMARQKTEMALMKRDADMQYQAFQLSEQSVNLVNQKYHDLKHQLVLLRSEVGGDERNAYLDRMEQEIKDFAIPQKTGNRVADVMLAAKELQCCREGISFTAIFDGSLLNGIEPTDLSALLGNLLDNAIEAVSKIPEGKPRVIEAEVSKSKGFTVLCVRNNFSGVVTCENGLPKTTKGDVEYHGYGTKSVRMIAEKYGGQAVFEVKEPWFTAKVMLPE